MRRELFEELPSTDLRMGAIDGNLFHHIHQPCEDVNNPINIRAHIIWFNLHSRKRFVCVQISGNIFPNCTKRIDTTGKIDSSQIR